MAYGISATLLLGRIKSQESQNSHHDFREPTTDLLLSDTKPPIVRMKFEVNYKKVSGELCSIPVHGHTRGGE
jgi:hypothetical protein